MTDTELLQMLKLNLEIVTDYMDAEAKTAKEAELLQYLNASREYITREGIDIDADSVGDATILVMYASWLYGRRKADNSYGAMPRMLRYALNNRLFEQAINGSNTSKDAASANEEDGADAG